MESLIELWDLIAQNPSQFADKLAWICGRCPPIDSVPAGSLRVRGHSLMQYSPPSFGSDSIASFFNDFLSYVNKDSELSSDFAMAVAEYMGEINFRPILPYDADKLVSTLLERFEISVPSSPPRELSSQRSANHFQSNERTCPGNEVSNASGSSSGEASRVTDEANSASSSKGLGMNGGSFAWKSNVDIFGAGAGFNDGGGSSAKYKQSVQIDPKLLEQVRAIAKEQLQSMKRDWTEQGQLLKVRIDTKLASSKRLLHGTLALLIEATEACLFSVLQKLRICEELFRSLLVGISQITLTRGGQLLRVLLICFKPLVLSTCALIHHLFALDTWGSSQDAMFESVLKTCCEIIEFGWSKGRSPVDIFIMGLATSIRERNDYEEEVGSLVWLRVL
ncbi:unnamed protein product [Ilex paraguariensis]|uniref:PI4-kinase N-terminal domain-containing protein n=1 Tax=Ilex paraguariensis TaxID=185542 RepID=A0ABC8REX6_9AQUA